MLSEDWGDRFERLFLLVDKFKHLPVRLVTIRSQFPLRVEREVFIFVVVHDRLKVECNAWGFIHPELDYGKEASGLSSEKRVSRVPGR